MKNITNLINLPHYLFRRENIIINKGDISALRKALEKHCVEKEDIQELITTVKWDKPDFENRQLGEKANDWILKVFGKVVNCKGKINQSLTANSMATFIKQYYGID